MDTHDLKIIAQLQRHILIYLIALVTFVCAAFLVANVDSIGGLRSTDTYSQVGKIVFGLYSLYAIFCCIILFAEVIPTADERILVLVVLFLSLGFISLLYVIRKATRLLRNNGYKVGILGAHPTQFV